jgi:hypothetical protein
MTEEKQIELQALKNKMEQMEQKLTELSHPKIEYHITIHDLNIYDSKLDDLAFNLDKLDIKELSGALNIGNNFGPKVEQKPKEGKKEEKSPFKNHDNAEEEKALTKEKKEVTKIKVNDGYDIKISINDKPRDFYITQE